MLLAGLAGPIKERLGCKLVGWLQDEDGFVDGLGSPWAEKVWGAMRAKVPYFDLFLPVSHYYADLMQQRLDIPDDKLNVFTPGIDMSQYEAVGVLPGVPTVGFLGRMCPANGLDVAVSAFTELLRSQKQLSDVKLVISGGKTSADDGYIQEQKNILSSAGVIEKSQFFEDFDLEARLSFFKEISVLCSPSRQPPAYALNVMEAAACGVPFVAPKTGVFTEWAELTSAGIVYEPNTPEEVQKVIQSLLMDADKSKEMGQKGRQAALEHFDVRKNAEKLVTMLSEIK
jgi:glycosyltransferase involved in cell wall biosynthesis